jgi:CubicO group peptidase (beta-lactamase class C family)
MILCALILAGGYSPAAAVNKGREIDKLLGKYNEYHKFNGAALVAEGGRVILKKGYGYADMEWKVPNKPDTKFRIGSLTKQFTAVLILQLIDEGKLGLYDKISDHIQEYPPEQGQSINVHQLLTHTSGIPNYTTLPRFMSGGVRDRQSPEELMAMFADLDLEFEPGTEFRYSNSNYVVLGIIIERITGEPLAEVLKERITDRFDLDDTGYDNGIDLLDKTASGYEIRVMDYARARYVDMSTPYASGAMYSTVEDLFKWDQVLYGDQLFQQPMYKDLMFTPYNENYGYGWSISDHQIGATGKTTKVIQHGGGLFGFSATFWRMVDDKNTIILLDNTATLPQTIAGIAEQIFNILYDQPFTTPAEPIGLAMRKLIDTRGVDYAVRRYHKLREKSPDAYDFGERELNTLGYHYLRGGDTETAIDIFKLNVEAYPDAFNPYDSLGEGYMVAGDYNLAIQNYKRSLELNPDNDNARRMLSRMGIDPSGRNEISLSEEVLDRYVGKYELQPGFIIAITRDGDHLIAQATGQPPATLYAESETSFFFRVIDAQISFQIRPDGTAEQLTLHQNGLSISAPRVE